VLQITIPPSELLRQFYIALYDCVLHYNVWLLLSVLH